MAGGAVTASAGPRRAIDSEINMVPMIDLMMVTISFLLITAVWTHLARIDATANVPGQIEPAPPDRPAPRLHVEMADPARFVLHWNEGATVIRTRDVPRLEAMEHAPDGTLRFPELAAALEEEHRAAGVHTGARDRMQDTLVLHTADDAPYAAIVAAMDAAYAVKRAPSAGTGAREGAGGAAGARTAAFAVTLATH